MANSETTRQNSELENDPQEIADDELDTVSGGLLGGTGVGGDTGVCVND